jgi:hypothetical protein
VALPKNGVDEAMNRLFREVDDDAHRKRLGLIFRSGSRSTLTRQRQRRVACAAVDKQVTIAARAMAREHVRSMEKPSRSNLSNLPHS